MNARDQPWEYWQSTSDGFSRLRRTMNEFPPQSPWILAPICTSCGRPSLLPARVAVAALVPSDGAANVWGVGCWHSPPMQPLTAELAIRSCLDGLLHILPMTRVRQPCTAAGPLPHFSQVFGDMQAAYGRHIPDPTPSDAMETLRVLSVNCEGVSKKLQRLTALLYHTQADIVCLQETGKQLSWDDLPLMDYLPFNGLTIPGGGLCTLLRRSRFPMGVGDVLSDAHILGIAAHVTTTCMVRIVNLHLPPSMESAVRRGQSFKGGTSDCHGLAAAWPNVSLHMAGLASVLPLCVDSGLLPILSWTVKVCALVHVLALLFSLFSFLFLFLFLFLFFFLFLLLVFLGSRHREHNSPEWDTGGGTILVTPFFSQSVNHGSDRALFSRLFSSRLMFKFTLVPRMFPPVSSRMVNF